MPLSHLISNWFCAAQFRNQLNCISQLLDRLTHISEWTKFFAVELSVITGVLFCVCPKPMRARRSPIAVVQWCSCEKDPHIQPLQLMTLHFLVSNIPLISEHWSALDNFFVGNYVCGGKSSLLRNYEHLVGLDMLHWIQCEVAYCLHSISELLWDMYTYNQATCSSSLRYH